jgi:hypothetical protein
MDIARIRCRYENLDDVVSSIHHTLRRHPTVHTYMYPMHCGASVRRRTRPPPPDPHETASPESRVCPLLVRPVAGALASHHRRQRRQFAPPSSGHVRWCTGTHRSDRLHFLHLALLDPLESYQSAPHTATGPRGRGRGTLPPWNRVWASTSIDLSPVTRRGAPRAFCRCSRWTPGPRHGRSSSGSTAASRRLRVAGVPRQTRVSEPTLVTGGTCSGPPSSYSDHYRRLAAGPCHLLSPLVDAAAGPVPRARVGTRVVAPWMRLTLRAGRSVSYSNEDCVLRHATFVPKNRVDRDHFLIRDGLTCPAAALVGTGPTRESSVGCRTGRAVLRASFDQLPRPGLPTLDLR